jgi:pimeloyl-ACP methyl ester carboxylesterase
MAYRQLGVALEVLATFLKNNKLYQVFMAKQSSQRKARAIGVLKVVQPTVEPRSGMLELATGHQIYYADSGGSGPVLFYLYGLGCSIAHWKYQLAYFASEHPGAQPPALQGSAIPVPPYRQVWFDFRGHGRSPPLPAGEKLTMCTIVADVVALANFLGIRQATFLGQSMGGSLVLQLARDYPKLVRSLVLLASPVRNPSHTLPMQPFSSWLWRSVMTVQERMPAAVKYANIFNALLLQYPVLAVPLREFLRVQGFNPNLAQTADVDEYVRQMLAIDVRLFTALAAELNDFDAVHFARQIKCPVLMIAGAHDLVVPPSESRRLLRHLPNGQLALIPHGSHCPHFDDPTLVNAILAEFFRTPDGMATAAPHER